MNPPGSAQRPSNGGRPRSVDSTWSLVSRMVKMTRSTVTWTSVRGSRLPAGMRNHARRRPYDEQRVLARGAHACRGSGVEVEEVAFDAVAEDDPPTRHQRLQLELAARGDVARYHAGARVSADERLAHGIEQPWIVPIEPNPGSTTTPGERRHSSGHVEHRGDPA